MADMSRARRMVEPFIRQQLGRRYRTRFSRQTVTLTSGGNHAFDAVSEDGNIAASIITSGGPTKVGGNKPTGKIARAVEALYYLSLAPAQVRLLVLTSPEFYGIMVEEMQARLAPGLAILHIPLPPTLQKEVAMAQDVASNEAYGSEARS